ncbi:MAG: hypothetical protein NVV72_17385 [Asticcacaulis sp.]|nr:hypothetical protein [Asticcacaulis sp.]
MSTARQATNKPSADKRAARTDAAHRSQCDDPAEGGNIQEGRLPKSQSGRPHRQGQGVDETGKDSKAPHTVR